MSKKLANTCCEACMLINEWAKRSLDSGSSLSHSAKFTRRIRSSLSLFAAKSPLEPNKHLFELIPAGKRRFKNDPRASFC